MIPSIYTTPAMCHMLTHTVDVDRQWSINDVLPPYVLIYRQDHIYLYICLFVVVFYSLNALLVSLWSFLVRGK